MLYFGYRQYRVSYGESNILRNEIANKLEVTRDKVMLCFSHTHSAPNVTLEQEYYLIYYIYNGIVMPLNRDTADKLVQIVSEQWRKMR